MREFPTKFIYTNLAQFQQYKYDRDICYLREAIYEFFINEKPSTSKYVPFETPFDLSTFESKYNSPRFSEMVTSICKELEKLGWATKLGFNNSSLWIYSKENPPKSLPDW